MLLRLIAAQPDPKVTEHTLQGTPFRTPLSPQQALFIAARLEQQPSSLPLRLLMMDASFLAAPTSRRNPAMMCTVM